MSGGSLGYLFERIGGLPTYDNELETASAAIRRLGAVAQTTLDDIKEYRRAVARANELGDALEERLHAIEWWLGGDWGPEPVEEALLVAADRFASAPSWRASCETREPADG